MIQANDACPLLITVNVALPSEEAGREGAVGLFMRGDNGKDAPVLDQLLQTAARTGCKLVFFLDYCAQNRHGMAVRQIARMIARYGQEVAPLLHPQILKPSFWERRGLKAPERLLDAGDEQMAVLLDYVIGQHLLALGSRPLCARGMNFEYTRTMLQMLATRHVKFHSGVAPVRYRQPLWLMRDKPFRWEDGPVELPLTTVRAAEGEAWRDLYWARFPSEASEALAHLQDVAAACTPDTLHLVAIDLHRFLLPAEKRPRPDAARLAAFKEFLAAMAGKWRTWSLRDVENALRQELLAMDAPVPMEIFEHHASQRALRMAERNPKQALEEKWKRNPELLSEHAEQFWNDPARDPERMKSVALFEKAYELGETRWAAYRLGYACFYGMGTQRDVEKAMHYLMREELDDLAAARFVRSRVMEDPSSSRYSIQAALEEMQAALELGLEHARKEVHRLKRKLQARLEDATGK